MPSWYLQIAKPVAGIFMSWVDKISKIVLINLPHREDRLLKFAKQAENYNIPYARVIAIHNEQGAIGLRDTMQNLFLKEIEHGTKNLLVFEDDALLVVPPEIFHDSMNKVVDQLPENYWMCFLGCQITGSISHFHSPNVIQASKMFSTHAVLYSLQGMKEIIGHGFKSPIDNYYVDEIESQGNSFCSYPLLCSQDAGYSDICKNEISWRPFIEARYETKIGEFNGNRR